jgi:hypothetical protein
MNKRRGKRGSLPPRRGASREPFSEVHVFVEGSVTEKNYLDQLKRIIRSNLVRIHTHSGQGVPKTLVEAASTKIRALRASGAGEPYEVWAVFDVDQHPNLAEALEQARANGIGVCLSDPCFELWLVFHFRDFDAPVHRHDIQRELRNHCATYKRSGKEFSLNSCGPGPADQLNAIDAAVRRAQTGLRLRAAEGGRNPSTTCHELIIRLRQLCA